MQNKRMDRKGPSQPRANCYNDRLCRERRAPEPGFSLRLMKIHPGGGEEGSQLGKKRVRELDEAAGMGGG